LETDNFKKIDTTAKFSNFKVLNPDFIRCRCNVMYPGRNRNYTDITKKAVLKLIERKGYANVPVVGHIKLNKNGKKIMGSHDRKLEISNDGIQEINECTAMGVVPENCDPSFEKIIDKHGIEREYFSVDVILWSHYFPDLMETAYSDEIYFNHSMEIRMNETEWDDDYIVINDFSLQALCLLGKSTENPEDNSEPCFEDSVVKRFSVDTDKFKQNFELMLEKLKQYESDGTSNTATTTVQNNATNNNPQMEGDQKMDLTKFTTLLSDIKCEGNDCMKYELLSADESKIYVLDKENGCRIYSVEYVMANDDPVINWKTKTEGDITFTEKSEENDSRLTMIYNELNEALNKKYEASYNVRLEEKLQEVSQQFESKQNELQAERDTLKSAYAVAKEKLAVYEAAENEKAKQDHIDAVKATLERFEKKIGKSPEFIYFKAKLGDFEKVDLDKLDKDLTLMSGEILINSNKSKTFSYSPTSANVTKYSTENDIKNRYGNLLDGFMD